MNNTQFEKFLAQNVNKYTEKKNGLTYLSWTYAWQEFKKAYPNARYDIHHWDGAPFYYDSNLGYMVETTVDNGEGMVLDMWLPVMNGANKAMKDKQYSYFVKNYKTGAQDEKTVEAATMFDINTSIMRCLVKNIAMFGLGLYIYAGEDLPEPIFVPITEEQLNELKDLGCDMDKVLEYLKVDSVEKISKETADALIKAKKMKEEKNA